ncbi:MAG: MFS transporter [Pseudomonadota bacterium]
MKSEAKASKDSSAWAPFRSSSFAVLWTATVLSNIGTWMHDVGASWLMTELSPSPAIVALVQAATTLPVSCFALLAGAIADIVDRRRLLIVINIAMAAVATVFTLLVAAEMVTPVLLLIFTFLLGTGFAFMAPAWQAVVPSLVTSPVLPAAVSMNSMGINISRAIGPALAGFLIVSVGLTVPFALNVVSVLCIVAALLWWRPEQATAHSLPPEHVLGAMKAGLRFAANSAPLQQTLVRAVAFFLFASAYWAMLPLIAKTVLGGGAALYGVLLACVGAGAVLGALVMPRVRKRLGPDWTVAAGSLGTSLVLVLFAITPSEILAGIAAGFGGICWIAVLSSLNVSAQTALPNWVRARGLSVFLTAFFGTMTLGSLLWGQAAELYGIPTALLLAAVGIVLAIPLTWRAKLGIGETLDFTPSMHWPEPAAFPELDADDRPVMIQITYSVAAEQRAPFLEAMRDLAAARRRLGGFGWTLMEDIEVPGQFAETWREASWLQHLRHHERVSESDRAVQDRIRTMLVGGSEAVVRHFATPAANASSAS